MMKSTKSMKLKSTQRDKRALLSIYLSADIYLDILEMI